MSNIKKLGVIVLTILGIVANVFVGMILFNVFVADVFLATRLSFWQAGGLMLCFEFFAYKFKKKEDNEDNEDVGQEFIEKSIYSLNMALIALLLAAPFYYFGKA